MWNAKPSGAYALESAKGKENILEISSFATGPITISYLLS